VTFRDELIESAVLVVVSAAAGALLGADGEVGKGLHEAIEVDMSQPEGPDARSVDHPATAGQREGNC
jgi:hypothetical protein